MKSHTVTGVEAIVNDVGVCVIESVCAKGVRFDGVWTVWATSPQFIQNFH